MSVVNMIDRVTKWAWDEICSKIKLKLPPSDDKAPVAVGVDYKLVTPAAFSMYVPTKEKLPPNVISPIPSLCVRCVDGAEDLASNSGIINLQFCFSTWDTGLHGSDVLIPDAALNAHKWTGPEASDYFSRNNDGWRDAWNWVDIALRELESVTNIDGLLIDRSTPIKYGPLTEQEAIPDYYPFWFAWVSFSLAYPLMRNIKDLENFL